MLILDSPCKQASAGELYNDRSWKHLQIKKSVLQVVANLIDDRSVSFQRGFRGRALGRHFAKTMHILLMRVCNKQGSRCAPVLC